MATNMIHPPGGLRGGFENVNNICDWEMKVENVNNSCDCEMKVDL